MAGLAGKNYTMTQRVQKLVEKSQRSGFFQGKKITLGQRINWGTVNECWVLHSEEKQYLARLGKNLPDEFIRTWQSELKANQIAAEAGLAPQPIYIDEDSLAAIYPWCGDPLSQIKLNTELLKEISNRLSLLHCIESPVHQIGYRDTIENYLSIIGKDSKWFEENQIDQPALLEKADLWDQSEDIVFCHHDLNPENILWNGEHCTFIDWEYARRAHPLFDLASLSKYFALSDEELDLLLSNYHRQSYFKEQVRDAEQMVHSLEQLWLESARIALFNKDS